MISITRIKREVNHILKSLAIATLLVAAITSFTAAPAFAADYNQCPYGVSTFQDGTCASSGGTGTLANTGQNVLFIISGAALAVGVGGLIILRVSRNKKHSPKPSQQ